MPAWKLEGRDVWPLLSGDKEMLPPAPLYWNVPRTEAVMMGDWKLIVSQRKDVPVELYHLGNDPAEKKNVAEENPKQVETMRAAPGGATEAQHDGGQVAGRGANCLRFRRPVGRVCRRS